MSSSHYVAVRDESGPRSLSSNERDFLRSCALDGDRILRVDGRSARSLRKIKLHLGRWDNGAECTTQWGSGTRVSSSIVGELVPPLPDRPNEGMVHFFVDLSPMASTSFRLAPPVTTGPQNFGADRSAGRNFSDRDQRLLSNRILRCLERVVLIGGALDTEALVVVPDQWVWRLTLNITILDHGGNLVDACVLAAMSALRHYRKPHVDVSNEVEVENTQKSKILPTLIPSIVKEATPLPLHHTPLSISFALIPAANEKATAGSSTKVTTLVDPTDREEFIQAGSVTIAMNAHAEVCLLDFGGGCEIAPDKLKDCWREAEGAIRQLCGMLEDALREADEQAQEDRVKRLKEQEEHGISLPSKKRSRQAFLESDILGDGDDEEQEKDGMEVDDTSDANAQAKERQEDEAYRQMALDFAQSHVAHKVREDSDAAKMPSRSAQQKAGSLMATLLRSVGPPKGDDGSKLESKQPEAATAPKADGPAAAKKVSSNPKRVAPPNTSESSDDEEETTTTLTNEFADLPPHKTAN